MPSGARPGTGTWSCGDYDCHGKPWKIMENDTLRGAMQQRQFATARCVCNSEANVFPLDYPHPSQLGGREATAPLERKENSTSGASQEQVSTRRLTAGYGNSPASPRLLGLRQDQQIEVIKRPQACRQVSPSQVTWQRRSGLQFDRAGPPYCMPNTRAARHMWWRFLRISDSRAAILHAWRTARLLGKQELLTRSPAIKQPKLHWWPTRAIAVTSVGEFLLFWLYFSV